ncbi:MAG: hypothetical protein ACTHN7_10075 [Solirubrobacterales bacterium]
MRFATPIVALVLLAAASGCGSSGESSPGSTASPGGGSSASPAGASVHACPLNVDGIGDLRATGVSCGEAQRIASAWHRGSGCAAPGASHSACTVRGYRCIGTATSRGLSVGCARPGRSVAFTVRSDPS